MPETDSATKESAEQKRAHQVHPPAEPAAEVEPIAPVAADVQRAVASPQTASPAGLLALQRTAGNQAVVRLLGRAASVQRMDMDDLDARPTSSTTSGIDAGSSARPPEETKMEPLPPGAGSEDLSEVRAGPASTASGAGPSQELPAAPGPSYPSSAGPSQELPAAPGPSYPSSGGGGGSGISMGGPIGMPADVYGGGPPKMTEPEMKGPEPIDMGEQAGIDTRADGGAGASAQGATAPALPGGTAATPGASGPSEELPAAPGPAAPSPPGWEQEQGPLI